MVSYNEFISRFEIYPTRKAAMAKGYEAHHIIPLALQDETDDRCVRLTPYEHIYAHYLLALENKNARLVFYNMVHYNFSKLSDIEQISLEQLEEWAKLREEGRKKFSNKVKGRTPWNKGIPCSEEQRKKISNALKGRPTYIRSEECRRKTSLSKIGNTYTKGKLWFNNGKINKRAYECPDGFIPGRLKMKNKAVYD